MCSSSNPLSKVINLFEIPTSSGLPPSKDINVIVAFFKSVVLATEALNWYTTNHWYMYPFVNSYEASSNLVDKCLARPLSALLIASSLTYRHGRMALNLLQTPSTKIGIFLLHYKHFNLIIRVGNTWNTSMGLQHKLFQNIYGNQRPQPPLMCTLITNL